jgi:CRP/FNR family transcriptional regulator, cyclic AMP receptor protein
MLRTTVSEPRDQLSGLSTDQLDALRRVGRETTYARGETIFGVGSQPDFAVIIERGRVKVTAEAETGFTSLLGFRTAGDLIGEFSCIDGAPRSASIIAMTEVTACLIAASKFRRVLHERADIVLALFTITISRLRESDQRRLEFGAYLPFQRVTRALLDLVKDQHGEPAGSVDGPLRVETNRLDLASAAGASKPTTDRTLLDLTKSGAISTGKGTVMIHDLDLLRRIATRKNRVDRIN